HGTLTVAADGSYVFTAESADWNGSDSFTVRSTDALGGTTDHTVTITVNPTPDAIAYPLPKEPTPSQPASNPQQLTNGDDRYQGGGNTDGAVSGLGGNDTLKGGAGNDYLSGDGGNDDLRGGSGNDYLTGGSGNDTLSGGTGNDTMLGGANNDSLDGGDGSDVIYGGSGSDWISGGSGIDALWGGDPLNAQDGVADIFAYATSTEGCDVIHGFTVGEDKVDLHLLHQLSNSYAIVAVDTNADGTADSSLIQVTDGAGIHDMAVVLGQALGAQDILW
ncbi:MAG: calcium-binding protein, partial [Solirubrobacterales bacterium]